MPLQQRRCSWISWSSRW